MTNKEMAEKGQEYVMNTYARYPICLVKGKGSYVWDQDNKQYLDFVGGIAVCALGHSNEELMEALTTQAHKLWHVSNLYWIEPQVELAKKLVTEADLGKAFFCNSGAEANEGAIKLVRKYFYRKKQENKHEIIVFKNSFHGRTLATVTATGQSKYQQGFAPLPAGFVYADFNDLSSVKKLINEKTAAIMVEPVQGEGGVLPADYQFLHGLKEICDENNLLLVFDEVQAGMGRTGTLFAFQSYGVTPDIVTLAKGLGGGFPIGALLASQEAASGFEPGDHASTFGGNPLATAVARQAVEIISDAAFLQQVEKSGHSLMELLKGLDDDRIVAVRGQGLLLGVEFNTEIKPLLEIGMRKGLLLIGAGPRVLRLVPPLNISQAEIQQAVDIIRESLREWKL
jgi:acetylornithine/N-succinyldiaminopimelate aminotransferase